MYKSTQSKIIVALDYSNKQDALALINQLDPRVCRFKVGKNMFTQFGPEWIKFLQVRGFEVFLDLKFHDIPQTVASACQQAARLGVWMINVHASGGLKMLKAAKDALLEFKKPPLLIGVTVLTSLSQDDLKAIGFQGDMHSVALGLAGLCSKAGLDGVVCSAQEASVIKQEFGSDFLCVTPGIRLEGDALNDQVRTMTPRQALEAGADYLVMGRSVTGASNPHAVLESLMNQTTTVLGL